MNLYGWENPLYLDEMCLIWQDVGKGRSKDEADENKPYSQKKKIVAVDYNLFICSL